ncbi:hypothetical protein [Actinoplanes palleronii]|uniref:Uncharacterized protein n=1 Tax=Actinoplanes palleronii TaxID=113570 RepID=A0ABQ4BIJ1_9ACTN|nr:hypothetical protein [Actinoplanes palleronii]GIE70487.1 hypothetical protein Apa02nite_065950 [Actinoplanes palleronii]
MDTPFRMGISEVDDRQMAQRNADHSEALCIHGQRSVALQTSAHVTRMMAEDHQKDRFNRSFTYGYPAAFRSFSAAGPTFLPKYV